MYKVVQILPGLIAACLHTNQSQSYFNHLVSFRRCAEKEFCADFLMKKLLRTPENKS